ncbi:MAG: DUF882 domain-containing protein [Candidatus Eremiobacteraeota bacterium]|nr:DUF882 domain-containing protein [Candidatus Eremiobacteraeota bacterium]
MCHSCGPAPRTTRRRFVSRGLLFSSAALLGGVALLDAAALPIAAAPLAETTSPYTLWLERRQTGETVAAPFTLDGKTLYWPGYKKLCAVLRDERVAARFGYVQISVRTIEALWAVQQYLRRLRVDAPIIVHSGYRTPQTNALTEGAARYSLHMWGKAVDFHVDAVPLADLAGICLACPIRGGVGYYPDGWVHLDTGPRRYWES